MKNQLFIILISIAIFSCACSSNQKTPVESEQSVMESKDITGIKWQLIELYARPVAATINNKIPFILLQDTSNRYVASAGCNGLGGTYTLPGDNRIKFSQGMSTMMACPDMEVETALKKVLQQADNYTLKDDTLSLNKARMAPLARFYALKENETTSATP